MWVLNWSHWSRWTIFLCIIHNLFHNLTIFIHSEFHLEWSRWNSWTCIFWCCWWAFSLIISFQYSPCNHWRFQFSSNLKWCSGILILCFLLINLIIWTVWTHRLLRFIYSSLIRGLWFNFNYFMWAFIFINMWFIIIQGFHSLSVVNYFLYCSSVFVHCWLELKFHLEWSRWNSWTCIFWCCWWAFIYLIFF